MLDTPTEQLNQTQNETKKKKREKKPEGSICALKVRLYPTAEQRKWMELVFFECNRWYNTSLSLYKDSSYTAYDQLHAWDVDHGFSETFHFLSRKHVNAMEEEERKEYLCREKEFKARRNAFLKAHPERKEFIKTCGFPSNRKDGFPSTDATRAKYKELYGATPLIVDKNPYGGGAIYEYVEVSVSKAVTDTAKINCSKQAVEEIGFASSKFRHNFTIGVKSKSLLKADSYDLSPIYGEYRTTNIVNSFFKWSCDDVDKKRNVVKCYIPFLPLYQIKDSEGNLETVSITPFKRNKNPEALAWLNAREWVSCALSEKMLQHFKHINTITVTRDSRNNYYASFVGDRSELSMTPREKTGMECGIDIGLKTTAVIAYNAEGFDTTDYEKYETYNLDVPKLKYLEQTVSFLQKKNSARIEAWMNQYNKNLEAQGKTKGFLSMNGNGCSNASRQFYIEIKTLRKERKPLDGFKSFIKTEARIKKLQGKMNCIRENFANKLASDLSKKVDVVGLEDLGVQGMTKRGKDTYNEETTMVERKKNKLSKAILRVSPYKIRIKLEHKFGTKNVIFLDRFAPSSQTCSVCGYINEAVKDLKVREWTCPQCHTHHDRDQNAASNIRPSRQYLCVCKDSTENKK